MAVCFQQLFNIRNDRWVDADIGAKERHTKAAAHDLSVVSPFRRANRIVVLLTVPKIGCRPTVPDSIVPTTLIREPLVQGIPVSALREQTVAGDGGLGARERRNQPHENR